MSETHTTGPQILITPARRVAVNRPDYKYPEPDISYPYELPLINPGAEMGDMTGWTVTQGNITSAIYSKVPGAEGSERWFYPNQTSISVMHQDVAFPLDAVGAVDAGSIRLEVSFYRSSYVGHDKSRVGIQYIDEAGELTDIEWTELVAGPARGSGIATWDRYTYLFDVPVAARAIRYTVSAHRGSGSSNDALTDIHRAALILNP